MKERNWKELGEELKNIVEISTPATAVEVKVVKQALELHPTRENDGKTFYHLEEVVDFCRCKRLSNYVTYDCISGNIICSIY